MFRLRDQNGNELEDGRLYDFEYDRAWIRGEVDLERGYLVTPGILRLPLCDLKSANITKVIPGPKYPKEF